MNQREKKITAYSLLAFGILCLWSLFTLQFFLLELPKDIVYTLIFPGSTGIISGLSILIIKDYQ